MFRNRKENSLLFKITLALSRIDKIPGWMNEKELLFLFSKVLTLSSKDLTLVEVGSWLGRSTSVLAEAILIRCKNDKLHVVDTFCGDENILKDKQMAKFLLNDPDYIYNRFIKNTKEYNGIINVHRQESSSAAKEFHDQSIDFLFIDAAHDYFSIKNDITSWLPKLKRGAIMAGHDYADYGVGVKQAVNELFGSQFELFETIWHTKV